MLVTKLPTLSLVRVLIQRKDFVPNTNIKFIRGCETRGVIYTRSKIDQSQTYAMVSHVVRHVRGSNDLARCNFLEEVEEGRHREKPIQRWKDSIDEDKQLM